MSGKFQQFRMLAVAERSLGNSTDAEPGEIEKILDLFGRNQLTSWPKFYGLTVAKAVDELITLGEKAAKSYS